MRHRYTHEQELYIRSNIQGIPYKELAIRFNQKFGTEINTCQLQNFSKRRGLSNGRDTRFPKGYKSPFGWKKGECGSESTQFKNGHTPHSYKPIGTERVSGDGYVEIKVAAPNVWKKRHVLIWEKENGPVPPGHVILFGDGNRRNFDLDNLILVTRKQLGMLNQKGLIQDHADLTRTGIIIADLYGKIAERRKSK
ncbi:HNH endonuclease signature motif containing protein [Rossellomorea vietnamensis]|uniref:HNH endonuclease signature motif containing protein n=1 Tax=Rossellomorea vietnamensis TaxID=218284 RepID=UPI000553091B|nr:HNH endonuclease signature motif containing protein [Rossellomorea vietnamensis]